MNKDDLVRTAISEAISFRKKHQIERYAPVNPIDLALASNIDVRIVEINMEGMYHGGLTPAILLSSLRPFGRRNFTCAHELGHHVFGHGSSIDDLRDEAGLCRKSPNEILADSFACHLMMPIPAIRGAFAKREVETKNPDSLSVMAVSSSFGVGYDTLITHLEVSGDLPGFRAQTLRKKGVATERTRVLGFHVTGRLVVVDEFFEALTVDVEVGDFFKTPSDVVAEGAGLAPGPFTGQAHTFEATKPGIARLYSESRRWAVFVRVCRKGYFGMAEYRHLEEPDE